MDHPAEVSGGEDGGLGAGEAGPFGAIGDVGGGGSARDGSGWDPPPGSYAGPCSDVTHHIYLVSPYQELFSFHPASLELHRIGRLPCGDGRPFSMAVDRNGVAWIVDWNGSVIRVDIATGRCEATPYKVEEGVPFSRFGMAFAADDGPDQETLYVRDAVFFGDTDEVNRARTLGVFDRRSYAVHPLGQGAGANADLTGTGDGRLFGFVKQPAEGSFVSELDKLTGATLSERALPGVTIGSSWAFATWGGAFWFFVTNDQDVFSSLVYRLDPDSQAPPELVMPVLLTAVIGAGVSTCAPTEVPH
ncbi:MULTISPECIES: hypothetical protein [Sorangium]|uniref:hypothetical protein n=1 Tax=Sorangium TaxID=39643 RepID=UPI001F158201|nr:MULTISPECIES: hypothetical protein [Sorangium]